jgi:preprotein translocase subunit YajC
MPVYPYNLLTLAEGAADGAAATGSILDMIPTLGIMALMFGVLYFIMIRPQRKKDKAVKSMLAALKVSDRICTIGGIYGTVTALKDDSVTIVVGTDKVKLIVARWAIRSVEDAPLENDSEALV